MLNKIEYKKIKSTIELLIIHFDIFEDIHELETEDIKFIINLHIKSKHGELILINEEKIDRINSIKEKVFNDRKIFTNKAFDRRFNTGIYL